MGKTLSAGGWGDMKQPSTMQRTPLGWAKIKQKKAVHTVKMPGELGHTNSNAEGVPTSVTWNKISTDFSGWRGAWRNGHCAFAPTLSIIRLVRIVNITYYPLFHSSHP